MNQNEVQCGQWGTEDVARVYLKGVSIHGEETQWLHVTGQLWLNKWTNGDILAEQGAGEHVVGGGGAGADGPI